MYKAIFFDVDDTLLTFKTSSRLALSKAFDAQGLTFNENIFEVFREMDQALWAKQKQRLISVQEITDIRFGQFFERLHIDASAEEMKEQYQQNLFNEYALEPSALEVVKYLSPKYPLYVASNGFLAMQQSRLKLAGLFQSFADLYVSDNVGFEKPDSRFFEEVMTRSKLKSEEILFVGDSLEADITGAAGCNIATCWYNPGDQHNLLPVKPNYTIRHLSQLKEII
ncbi:YjjG family noncanonical pyrimidine nucleotidase [Chitinophaga sp. Cy-1792]|uniref:YjjG family noncanonical pyrimidine nucleotidase n=1 Tax=Chitinophaga sp. Cy-1792 TaxID=2608339 RepID=UPI00142284DB|nr:YjjG family noncanonical pyrimidine nucleotidase [Chitinophaga sp. Cy-1792]NIG54675.1 noncanonical pyrimidine nucleotidase, YjjG family [Chitinophaga sp. Cy-1792]